MLQLGKSTPSQKKKKKKQKKANKYALSISNFKVTRYTRVTGLKVLPRVSGQCLHYHIGKPPSPRNQIDSKDRSRRQQSSEAKE